MFPIGIQQFLILLYKDYLIRKRHYILTLSGWILPIFISCVPLMFLEQFNDQPYLLNFYSTFASLRKNSTFMMLSASPQGMYAADNPYNISESFRAADIKFLYTPTNYITYNLMTRALQKWINKTQFIGSAETLGYETETQLEAASLVLSKYPVVGTIFTNIQNSLPQNLYYTIRYGDTSMDTLFQSYNLYNKYKIGKRAEEKAYSETLFIGWQAAVEQTFIDMKYEQISKVAFDYQVLIGKFPHPVQRYKKELAVILSVWPVFVGAAFLFFGIVIVVQIMAEKQSGMKALMRGMGMSRTTHCFSCFLSYLVPGFLIATITTVIYKNPPTEKTHVILETGFLLLLFLFVSFIISLILFSMAFCVFFNKARPTVIYYIVFYALVLGFVGYHHVSSAIRPILRTLDLELKFLICLLPMVSIQYAFEIIFLYETSGLGMYWNSNYPERLDINVEFLIIFVANTVSCLMCVIILWYVDAVWPFQQGIPQPLYFPFTASYWKNSFYKKEYIDVDIDLDSDYFEATRPDALPGVVIFYLSKRYSNMWTSNIVINSLSMKIFTDEITIIVGHRKSGKTTLMDIIGCLEKPSFGKVFVDGWDTCTQADNIRKSAGICKENDVLYTLLTVHEHLQIFAALKGVPLIQNESVCQRTEQLLGLYDQRYKKTNALSPESKKKLSLGLAFVGDPKILLLDEPFTNLKSGARFQVWKILLSLKKKHTIIITSPYTEELEAIGDRLAILSHGELLCYGSPNFLKSKLGTGYKLHIVKEKQCVINKVLIFLEKYCHEVSLVADSETEACISFSCDNNGQMFKGMEEKMLQLGIKSIGVSVYTMEDVCMNESHITYLKSKNAGPLKMNVAASIYKDVFYKKKYDNHSWGLWKSRLTGLFFKRVQYVSRLWYILMFQLVVPFFLICVCVLLLNRYNTPKFTPFDLSLKSMYKFPIGFVEITNSTLGNFSMATFEKHFYNILNESDAYIYTYDKQALLEAIYNFTYFPSYTYGLLVGGSTQQVTPNDVTLLAWANIEHLHTSPIALSLTHTAVLRSLTGDGTIQLKNHPLPYYIIKTRVSDEKAQKTVISIFFPIISAFIAASYSLIPTHEKSSKAKLLQLMTGLQVTLYWLSMFLWDCFVHCLVSLVLIFPFVLSVFPFHHYEALALCFLLTIFGWCAIPFCYLTSLVFEKPSSAFMFVWISFMITGLLGEIKDAFNFPVSYVLKWIFSLFPSFCFTEGFLDIMSVSLKNNFCLRMPFSVLDYGCSVSYINKNSPVYECCRDLCGDDCRSYKSLISIYDLDGLSGKLLVMTFNIFIFFLLLCIFEAAIYQSYKGFMPMKFVENMPPKGYLQFPDVFSERERIENLLANGDSKETLMVLDLTKYYGRFPAVNKLTFGVSEGECFGIIGAHGAGVSTTFKMLTGEIIPNEGNAFIKDSNIVNSFRKFQSRIGYCPQYDALLNILTGREMLLLFAKLRGVVENDIITVLIRMMDVEDHADELIKYYSLGNKRKLAVATAVIGSSPVLLLDQPTRGVDVKSQRHIWNLVYETIYSKDCAIIFTSKSIAECQELCTKLAVMENGSLHCIGSLSQLEKKYSKGQIVTIILKLEALVTVNDIFGVKSFFECHVPGAVLMKYKQGVFTYHVMDPSMSLGQLFNFLDIMKLKFNLHDYLVNDISLREVYFAYARGQEKRI